MKQILLLRHAKSSWAEEGIADFDRPLAKRGINDAPLLGKYVRKIGSKPEMVVSSPAKRAEQTALLFLEAARCNEEIITWEKDLYFGTPSSYLKIIQGLPNSVERVLLVGHNPLMETVSSSLIGGSDRISLRMPTAAMAMVSSYASTWEQINWGTCELKWMVIPKVLKEIVD